MFLDLFSVKVAGGLRFVIFHCTSEMVKLKHGESRKNDLTPERFVERLTPELGWVAPELEWLEPEPVEVEPGPESVKAGEEV